jgi:hypothetical protein
MITLSSSDAGTAKGGRGSKRQGMVSSGGMDDGSGGGHGDDGGGHGGGIGGFGF